MNRLIFILFALTACKNDPPSSAVDPRVDDVLALTGDATAGETVYTATCAGCHAADGTGGTGPSLVDIVPAHEEAEIVDVSINGEGSMPGFANLSDQELADLLAYLLQAFG